MAEEAEEAEGGVDTEEVSVMEEVFGKGCDDLKTANSTTSPKPGTCVVVYSNTLEYR